MAEAGKDLVGVLTELRRWPVLGGLRRVGEVDRLADHLDIAELWMPHALGNAEMLHLRLGECLVDGVDRPAGHARVVQQLHPLHARSEERRVGEEGRIRWSPD